jgi:hypothetical protein
MGDIRKELKGRMTAMMAKANSLRQERDEIDKKLEDISTQLNALRVIYESEAKRMGGVATSMQHLAGMRFTGMGVIEALRIIKTEQPTVTRQQAHNILVKEGFDFQGKKSKRVVNFGWMALERSKK